MEKGGEDAKIAAAKEARQLVAATAFASIATVDVSCAAPYVSLVAVAEADGVPVLLLSGLARHTRNLRAEPRASLLYTAQFDPFGKTDPLAQPRVTLIGRISVSATDQDRAAFLDRHPAASAYADFGDFAFYRLQIEAAHFIGGFGRIVELTAADLDVATAARS